ncbi:DUF3800 domain-containing protein [Gulosibacter molinativorax]|uniref:DUF3800 domain-containing protein n=1 Tax=Gulosibacter molinativorax TaxID=256821 RepID=A0ABT7CA16_9MICO|nr:hypothetical protein [Gulosibacter molinativorax]MDJ1371639.1 hypothetical protein [Gulosibacter molinativorax]QUY61017.1 Hypotetical protein [Gulosibacter molinativorax]
MVTSSAREVRRPLLERAYAQSKSSHVAFVDESYLAPAALERRGWAGSQPFYLLTAFVAPFAEADAIRSGLRELVGGDFWRSSEANRSPAGRARLRRLIEHVAHGPRGTVSLVAVKAPVSAEDANAEVARSECMARLFATLFAGTHAPQLDLVVAEERHRASVRSADERTVKQLRKAGHIGRNDRVFWASPADEQLLWAPDIVSYALYRQLTVGGGEYLTRALHSRIKTVTVDGMHGREEAAEVRAAPACRSTQGGGHIRSRAETTGARTIAQ